MSQKILCFKIGNKRRVTFPGVDLGPIIEEVLITENTSLLQAIIAAKISHPQAWGFKVKEG